MERPKRKWFVYQVRLAGQLLYVGKGSGSRYLVSAAQRGGIGGIVAEFSVESAAMKAEKLMIAELNPVLNRTKGGEGGTHAITLRRERKIARQEAKLETKWRLNAFLAGNSGHPLDKLAALGYWRIDAKEHGIDLSMFDEYIRPTAINAANLCRKLAGIPLVRA